MWILIEIKLKILQENCIIRKTNIIRFVAKERIEIV